MALFTPAVDTRNAPSAESFPALEHVSCAPTDHTSVAEAFPRPRSGRKRLQPAGPPLRPVSSVRGKGYAFPDGLAESAGAMARDVGKHKGKRSGAREGTPPTHPPADGVRPVEEGEKASGGPGAEPDTPAPSERGAGTTGPAVTPAGVSPSN